MSLPPLTAQLRVRTAAHWLMWAEWSQWQKSTSRLDPELGHGDLLHHVGLLVVGVAVCALHLIGSYAQNIDDNKQNQVKTPDG